MWRPVFFGLAHSTNVKESVNHMLQAIRDRVTGVVAFIILGLLAVPFMFFGVESYFNTVPQDAVAVVGEEEISVNDFQADFARYRAQLRQQQGDRYDEIATNQPTVRREFLEELIDQALLRQHARSIGLGVSDETLLELIREIEAFQIAGQFSPEAYRQALAASGLTARGFEQEVRQDLMTRTVPTAITASSIVTEKEIDRMLAVRDEQRSIRMVSFASEDYAGEVTVTAEDIQRFYEENQSAYMTEEKVSLRYVELKAEDLTDGLTLTESELRQRYEAAEARFLSPELRRASHILLEINDERSDAETQMFAESLISQINEGEDFSALAEAHSADPISAEAGGDLGWIEPGQMMPAFEQALYDLSAAGDISSPVKTRFGWHVIRLDEIQPPEGLSFDEARDQILAEYIEQESEALYIELSERLVDLVFADDTTLEPVSAELGLDIQTTDAFTRLGGEGIAADPQVIQAAFSDRVLLDGAASDPIEIDRNHMVVVILDQYTPSQAVPLAEVEENIRVRLENEAKRDAASAAAQAYQAEFQAADGEGQEALLASFSETEVISRNNFQFGADFSRDLFRLASPEEGQATLHVLPTNDGYAVVRLEEVTPGDPTSASEQQREMMRQQIAFAQMGYEINALMEWLRANTNISVIEDRL